MTQAASILDTALDTLQSLAEALRGLAQRLHDLPQRAAGLGLAVLREIARLLMLVFLMIVIF